MKTTKAQQALIERAHRRDYNSEGYMGQRNMDSFNRLLTLSQQYDKKFFGATRLQGSSDFRVAYALRDKGLGRLASCQMVDGYWFIAEV